MVIPDSSPDMRAEMHAADLKPRMLAYAENLHAQIHTLLAEFGVTSIEELNVAVTKNARKFIAKGKQVGEILELSAKLKETLRHPEREFPPILVNNIESSKEELDQQFDRVLANDTFTLIPELEGHVPSTVMYEVQCMYLIPGEGGIDERIEDILARMARNGLRPATYEELLAFAAAFPEEQLTWSIDAAGSVSPGGYMPCIGRGAIGRYLSVTSRRMIWSSGSKTKRFLAVLDRQASADHV